MSESSTPAAKRGIEAKWLVLAAVMLGAFMGPIDASIVNTVLPDITGYFKTDISIAQWVPTVYLLTISCLILLYGRLGDMVGYKKIFLAGLAFFVVASILCGSSQSIWMLIAFRGIQGLAAGLLMAVGYAIITTAFPPFERGRAMGIYAISIAAGLGLGPTLGGLITQYLSWHYVFFINVPIGIAALIWGTRVIPKSTTKPGQKLDVAGALAALVFLSSLLLYANQGETWGWASLRSLVLVGIMVVSGALFFWIEQTSAQPMLNLALYKNRRFTFASTSTLLSFMALYAVVFLTPFYLLFVLHFSILKVGLALIASPLATMFVAPLSGAMSDRFGTRAFAVLGMCIAALGLFLMSGLNASDNVWDVVWRLVIIGLGMGMFQSPNNSEIMGSVPPWHLGIASGIIAAMRNVGMVLGIAIAGAVLYNLAPVTASAHPGSFSPADIQEFLRGLHWAFISGAGIALIAAFTSLLAADRRKQQAEAEGPSPSHSGASPGIESSDKST
jgi:EmrB/QacA subfamily drug resistance transporter